MAETETKTPEEKKDAPASLEKSPKDTKTKEQAEELKASALYFEIMKSTDVSTIKWKLSEPLNTEAFAKLLAEKIVDENTFVKLVENKDSLAKFGKFDLNSADDLTKLIVSMKMHDAVEKKNANTAILEKAIDGWVLWFVSKFFWWKDVVAKFLTDYPLALEFFKMTGLVDNNKLKGFTDNLDDSQAIEEIRKLYEKQISEPKTFDEFMKIGNKLVDQLRPLVTDSKRQKDTMAFLSKYDQLITSYCVWAPKNEANLKSFTIKTASAWVAWLIAHDINENFWGTQLAKAARGVVESWDFSAIAGNFGDLAEKDFLPITRVSKDNPTQLEIRFIRKSEAKNVITQAATDKAEQASAEKK